MAWYKRSSELPTSEAYFHAQPLRLVPDLISDFKQGERFIGSISTIKARAPVVGGNFGVWGGMFSTFDCAVKGYRQKEDAWNAVISGFMTGGCLALRSACWQMRAKSDASSDTQMLQVVQELQQAQRWLVGYY